MKRVKTLLSVFLFSLILLFSFISVAEAATTTVKTKSEGVIISFSNKKSNYEILGKSITVIIDGKTVFSGIISSSTKSTKQKTATIKNITIKKVDVDVTKNRSVPIKITIGDKTYNTYVNTSSLRHTYWKNIKIKAQYSTGKNPNLKGFIGYKLL